MCHTSVSILLIVIGAIAAFGFGLLSFWLQRNWAVRDAFHLTVAEQIAKLDEIDRIYDKARPDHFSKMEDLFVAESIPVLMAAARRAKRHIRVEERSSLYASLEAYKKYQAENKGIDARCKIDIAKAPKFSEAVHKHLETIDECITNNPVA
jgi:hypothetical protein